VRRQAAQRCLWANATLGSLTTCLAGRGLRRTAGCDTAVEDHDGLLGRRPLRRMRSSFRRGSTEGVRVPAELRAAVDGSYMSGEQRIGGFWPAWSPVSGRRSAAYDGARCDDGS